MKYTHTVNYEIIDNWSELSDQEQELVVKAQEASSKAYAPYSNFFVGASVLTWLLLTFFRGGATADSGTFLCDDTPLFCAGRSIE